MLRCDPVSLSLTHRKILKLITKHTVADSEVPDCHSKVRITSSPRFTRRSSIKYVAVHSCSLILLLQHYCGYWNHFMQIFPHRDVDMWRRVWMSHFRGARQNLNFDKEYLFGFETLVLATSGILSMHNHWNKNNYRKHTDSRPLKAEPGRRLPYVT